MDNITIQPAEKKDWPYIREKLQKYILDADGATWQKFFVAKNCGRTVAFGRIIDHGGYFEIGSLGVDYYHRRKGLGIKLLKFLVEEAKRLDGRKEIYGVTHRPEFVRKAGFEEIASGPEALEHKKRHKCKDPSRISIMKFKGV
ncbi:MAG: GNAT family N-acetyltransferase [Candidatus Omnitrophota bacterium]|nr:GNAT family N-acetyltransferase [Candidatus Omnitrophota bacterium]